MALECGDFESAASLLERAGRGSRANAWAWRIHHDPRADEAALIDVAWLDRCPLLHVVRGEPEFARLRTSVAARAAATWPL